MPPPWSGTGRSRFVGGTTRNSPVPGAMPGHDLATKQDRRHGSPDRGDPRGRGQPERDKSCKRPRRCDSSRIPWSGRRPRTNGGGRSLRGGSPKGGVPVQAQEASVELAPCVTPPAVGLYRQGSIEAVRPSAQGRRSTGVLMSPCPPADGSRRRMSRRGSWYMCWPPRRRRRRGRRQRKGQRGTRGDA
jgi:hypothetical protein